jgi:hypothetical protein
MISILESDIRQAFSHDSVRCGRVYLVEGVLKPEHFLTIAASRALFADAGPLWRRLSLSAETRALCKCKLESPGLAAHESARI